MEFINNKIKSLIRQFNSPDNLGEIELIQEMNEPQRLMFQKSIKKAKKRKKIGFILGIILGWLGAHRYYLGDYAIGAVYTLAIMIAIAFDESLIILPFIAALIECLSIMDKIDRYNRSVALGIAKKVQEFENPLIHEALERASNYSSTDNFEAAIKELKNVSILPGCQSNQDIQNKLTEYQHKLDRQILWKSSEEASLGNFNSAISRLETIQTNSEAYEEAQQKINEFGEALKQKQAEKELKEKEQQEQRANQFLQAGLKLGETGMLSPALMSLRQVPEETQAYEEAQVKIAEYEATLMQRKLEKEKEEQLKLEQLKLEQQRKEELRKHQQLQQEMLEKQKEAEKEKLIAQLPNLVPIHHEGELVAAALVDQTIHIVDEIERKRTIYGVLGNHTTASGEFIIIRLIVRNDSKKTRTISASMITLIDHEDRQFSTSSEGATALTMSGDETAEFLLTEIQPGLEKRITIVFEVPLTSKDLKLQIPSGIFGKSTILPLSLATYEF
ncbi:MAG: DUF4352 domain-containing protein [Planktothrix sp.]|uniref:DUF4352 domain-containing protein n=1 Tax=Planktothrix sp. TaxID=3088171 RepID=UPI0038D3BCF2